jgi:hypothetical protein
VDIQGLQILGNWYAKRVKSHIAGLTKDKLEGEQVMHVAIMYQMLKGYLRRGWSAKLSVRFLTERLTSQDIDMLGWVTDAMWSARHIDSPTYARNNVEKDHSIVLALAKICRKECDPHFSHT